ncbi:hypothetical protein ATK36_4292 [Amycolatopsis sulphurea]|uniref:Uncharacterized protein n=1 Tax=Amycolatopsis sulphurea TaxID=76022 RepID=A0A2A9FFH3_9PSEU|nr:hypothetical protein [Amycolatopsis sulphurea]PFG49159.1 hypothetical protein ATK36_4292 [Amycolatopsis sulphurea]
MRIYLAERLAVTVEELDFLNPNKPEDGRERGVRLEVRLVEEDTRPASIYANCGLTISRGLCRFDLLESAPGAQDRMHWHPEMPNGEGRKRLVDEQLSADPIGWVHNRLLDVVGTLELSLLEDPASYRPDAKALARVADAIVADTAATLGRMREPWPPVEERDERGMAVVR